MDPLNHVLDGNSDPPWEGAILRGKVARAHRFQPSMRWRPDGEFLAIFGSCVSSELRAAHFRSAF